MKCVEAQGLITKYINDELTGEKLEEFLGHIYDCEDCREELEIYYVIMKGMQQIDDDNVLNYNFHQAFEDELKSSRVELVQSNTRFVIKLFLLEILIILMGLLLTTDSANRNNVRDMGRFNGDYIESEK
ncbi:MAG: zf-HC2 domain-containing protein [Lachnospiraceae bacterium]|nr:zf-HC2 domain-containing protein [Lachnospiraceae bacterium]